MWPELVYMASGYLGMFHEWAGMVYVFLGR